MSLTESNISFNDLEKEIYRICCEAGRKIIAETLEKYDANLCKIRDRSMYRNKGKHKTSVKTIMGEVEFERTVYETNGCGLKKYVYLLDEAIGIKKVGQYSGMMMNLIAKACCESSYREASRSISECTGQSISHTAAWNLVQKVGGYLDEHEKDQISLSESGESIGTIETPVLFLEKDGIWLDMQGKDRLFHKSKEMKVSIAYDGAKLVGKKRYELTDKVACANFENSEDFSQRCEGIIAENYDVNCIQKRLVNGDGGGWVKEEEQAPSVYFQLDVFHKNKAIRKINDKAIRRKIFSWMYTQKNPDTILEYMEAMINSLEGDIEKTEDLQELKNIYKYFKGNKQGIIAFHKRKDIDIPSPPEDKEYRHLGCMESNIFTIIGNRMKKRRRCWSIKGGNNLARLLCLKHTNRMDILLPMISKPILPKRYSENIEWVSNQIPFTEGKGYEPVHIATAPPTMEFKWLRDLGTI